MKQKIILIGDSITYSFDVNKLLPEYYIINKGIYGDNSLGVLKRIEQDVIQNNPDFVFLLIGTNDFALERTDEELLSTINEIIISMISSLPRTKIFLTSILPTNKIENRPNDRILKVNVHIHNIAIKRNVNYFDLHSLLLDDDGNLNKAYTTDGLHLSDNGYVVWAKALRKLLNEQLHSIEEK